MFGNMVSPGMGPILPGWCWLLWLLEKASSLWHGFDTQYWVRPIGCRFLFEKNRLGIAGNVQLLLLLLLLHCCCCRCCCATAAVLLVLLLVLAAGAAVLLLQLCCCCWCWCLLLLLLYCCCCCCCTAATAAAAAAVAAAGIRDCNPAALQLTDPRD